MRPSPRLALLAALALVVALVLPLAAILGDRRPHRRCPTRVTLMGNLMSELGCAGDWDEGCDETDLPRVGDSSVFAKVFDGPGRQLRVQGAAQRQLGRELRRLRRRTTTRGGNIPLPLEPRGAAALQLRPRRRTPSRSRRPTTPAPLDPGGPRAGDDQPAQGPHEGAVLLRDGRPVRERRRPATTRGGLASDRAGHRLRPDRQGLLPRRRPQGPALEGSTTSRASAPTAIWLTPIVQEQARPGRRPGRVGRLPRLLDHRLHPDRPAPRHQRRPEAR